MKTKMKIKAFTAISTLFSYISLAAAHGDEVSTVHGSMMHNAGHLTGYGLWGMSGFGMLFGLLFWGLAILGIIYLYKETLGKNEEDNQ